MKLSLRAAAAVVLTTAVVTAGLSAGLSAAAGAAATVTVAAAPGSPSTSGASGWIKDSVHALDIFLPDADSDYYFDAYGTADGAHTVIAGRTPDARYWSFTAYPIPTGPAVQHVHDTDIGQARGRYTVTLAASCTGVVGTCLDTTSAAPSGIVVLRLYVPVEDAGAGTGGVALPSIAYRSATGAPVTLAQAAGTTAVESELTALRLKHGALPAALTRHYPPAAPVPTPIIDPPPRAVVAAGTGLFANPDNVYEHLPYTTTRGDLVVSAQAPTYRSDSTRPVNDPARSPDASPQVRYWSLCVALKGRYTGACLRDEQVHLLAGSRRFEVILAPTCPVSGYANCLPSGPEPLQDDLSYRNLLPSAAFAPLAFHGAYGLSATYVGRPR